jgi:hypothetical protein
MEGLMDGSGLCVFAIYALVNVNNKKCDVEVRLVLLGQKESCKMGKRQSRQGLLEELEDPRVLPTLIIPTRDGDQVGTLAVSCWYGNMSPLW